MSATTFSLDDLAHLRQAVAGEVLTDALQRHIHAADASVYEQQPQLVVRPSHPGDIAVACRWARRHGVPITARGAGTSLAGQTTGGGMILDCGRHFRRILAFDATGRTVTVEPGVVLDDLNDWLAPHGLFFGPETSTSNRCMFGGMIANNSCGTHSPRYGSTRDHVVSIDCILADGSSVSFHTLDADGFAAKCAQDDLEGSIYRGIDALMRTQRDAIIEAFPSARVTRRNTGYCLDVLAAMQPWNPDGPPCNLAPLICGSEGSLALIVRATLGLVERPRHRLLCAAHFEDVASACMAAVVAVDHQCYAGELIDDIILQATKDNLEQQRNRSWITGDPGAVLAIELEDDDEARLRQRMDALIAALQQQQLGYHHPVIEAADIDRVWALRKAGLGLLMGMVQKRKAVAVIEDAAVAPHDLPDYIAAIQAVLRKHGSRLIHYAHAAAGELHLRPELDLRDPLDLQRFADIAREAAETVKRFGGSLSGEHGDGRVRAPFIELVLGSEMVALFEQVKDLFDPDHILNPGKIVRPAPLLQDLRISPATPDKAIATAYDWSADLGLVRATEKCNGAGACRKSPGRGTMCPSYHVTSEEQHSTRGRANLFRRLISTPNPQLAFASTDLKQALELCLSCKACKSECPANVDMARLKSEFLHQYHRHTGDVSRADRFFGMFARNVRLARLFPRSSSLLANTRLGKLISGVDRRRSIPRFAPRSFTQWWDLHGGGAPYPSRGDIALFVDEFTEHLEPELAIDAVRVLHAAGWTVHAVCGYDSGRSAISHGLLDHARRSLGECVRALHGFARRGMPILGLEPSAILGFVDEAPDLVHPVLREQAAAVAAQTSSVEAFLAANTCSEDFRWGPHAPRKVHLHGHCHQKALTGTQDSRAALALVPDVSVDEIPSGCCGMAGSFGYEHYDVSMAIGEQILFPAVRAAADDAVICAPGTSCRHQVQDGTGREAIHPIRFIASCLAR